MADIHEIRVTPLEDDPHAKAIEQQAKQMLGVDVELRTARVYYVEGDVSESQAGELADQLFTDPLTEVSTVGASPRDHDGTVEVAYLPGVMNPEADAVRYASGLLLGKDPIATDSSIEYTFATGTEPEVVSDVISRVAMNDKVQSVREKTPETLVVKGVPGEVEAVPIRGLSQEELRKVAKEHRTFLDDNEFETLQDYFDSVGRDPTDVELGTIAARWSEHCCHKTMKAKIFKDGVEKPSGMDRITQNSIPNFGEDVVSAYEDNAGVFRFYEGMCINMKLETHNSPSALDPYGGAATGSGGVFRDVMGTGQGAKVILSIDIFGFAPTDMDPDKLPENCLDQNYIQQRVIDGVRDYGNRFGAPTAHGSVHYHEDFRAKPTVMVGALGILPEEYAKKGHPEPGDLVVTIGGRTGKDGINGATFSSGSMDSDTAENFASAVQIGNPIEEKKMTDALLEARDAGLIRAITDCGAAGFSSAIGEMGEEIGVQVDISKAPLKYEGLSPYEIWLSESQERMVAAITPENYERFVEICDKHGVEIAALGTFGTKDDEPKLHVMHGDQTVVELDYEFLNNGLSQREMIADWHAPEIEEKPVEVTDWEETIKQVLAHGNVCSKEPIVRQYDHEVQGTSAVKPYGGVHRDAPNDALVSTPILGKPYALVVAHGMNPILNNYDPYRGSKWAFAEAFANYTAVGGNPSDTYLANNFVTGSPDEHVMGALDMILDAEVDSIRALSSKVITGKDSMSSTYQNSDGSHFDVPPVITYTVAGKLPDVAKTVTSDLKQPGSTLVMVGKADYQAMGGSTLYDVLDGDSAQIPDIDLQQLPNTLQAVHQAIQTDQVLACHDISEGGLVSAISEMAFGGDCGVSLVLDDQLKPEQQLFNETSGCFVVEVDDEQAASELFANVPHRVIGKTTPEKIISATKADKTLFSSSALELKAAWKRRLEDALV